MKRWQSKDDGRNAILFLYSDDAIVFITGSCIKEPKPFQK